MKGHDKVRTRSSGDILVNAPRRPIMALSRKDRNDLGVLIALCASIAAVNFTWLSINSLPPAWDQANHLLSALRYHDVLAACFPGHRDVLRELAGCIRTMTYVDQSAYAPLLPFTAGMLSFISGGSLRALTMTNMVFMAVLIGSMYWLGRVLHSRTAGVLASVLVCSYPLVFIAAREFMIETALLSLTATSVVALLLSDRFTQRSGAVLFGIAAGLALLAKFTFVIFIAGPLVFELGRLAWDTARGTISRDQAKQAMVWAVIGGVLALSLASLWYLPNRASFVSTLQWIMSLESIPEPVFSVRSFLYYPRVLWWEQLSPALFILAVFGIFRVNAVAAHRRWFLFAWIGSIYAVCTLSQFKMPHNDIGIVLPLALVTAIGVSSLTRYRREAIGAVVAIATVQFITLSMPRELIAAHLGTFGIRGTNYAFPRSESWPILPPLRDLSGQPTRVAVLSDHEYLNGTTVQFLARANGLPLEVSPCWTLPKTTPIAFEGFDAVLAKSDAEWVRLLGDGCFLGTGGQKAYDAELDHLRRNREFRLASSMPLPDYSALLVFRRTVSATRVTRSP